MRHSGAAGKMVFDSGNCIPSEKHGRTSLSNTLKLMGIVVWKAGFSSHHTSGSQAREWRRLASEMLTLSFRQLPACRNTWGLLGAPLLQQTGAGVLKVAGDTVPRFASEFGS